MNEIIKSIAGTPSVLSQIYNDLASPSVKAIGNALGTVFEYGTNFLLPLKLKNEKMKATFSHNLDVYQKKLETIPEENRCEVHPQIGTPLVDKLTYTTNEEIAELFTSLLASASDNRTTKFVHPSFVGIIENLSVDEARIIEYLSGKEMIEFCSIRAYNSSGGFNTLFDHVTNISSDVSLLYPENVAASLSNLVRLGFLLEPPGLSHLDKTEYNRIRSSLGFEQLKKELVPSVYKKLECKEGYYRVTPFGWLFISAVFTKR